VRKKCRKALSALCRHHITAMAIPRRNTSMHSSFVTTICVVLIRGLSAHATA